MASTYSSNLRLELIATGEQSGTWGATTNTNLGTLLEEAIGGYVSVAVTDGADTVLTTNNGLADQARNMTINLTGTLSASRNVIVPAIEKIYVIKNATSGGFAVTVKVSGQTGVSVANGTTVLVFVDGTDVRQASTQVGASNALVATSIEVGNVTDTTITRSAAGVIAVEGGVVPKENRANTFTANQIISVTDNTNAALRITQLGTGLALRVEDTTNPDSTPFAVDANGNVGIQTASPAVALAVNTTDAILVPVGTTAQRPTAATGYIRYNTTTSQFEGYGSSAWAAIGGGATGGGADAVFFENDQTVTVDYTITTGKNAGTFGPISVASNVTVTVPSGSTWSIV